jgi:hypothetical protein
MARVAFKLVTAEHADNIEAQAKPGDSSDKTPRGCSFNPARSGHFAGRIATPSISNRAPGRASSGTPIVVLAGGVAVLRYLSRISLKCPVFLPISTM